MARVLISLVAAASLSAALVAPAPRVRCPCLVAAAKKGGSEISPELKSKLLQEAASPWRTVRQFFYGGFGLSASIGGFTALTQFAAAVTDQPGALPLAQTLTNVAVDFGVVAACVYGNSIDSRSAADVVDVADDDAKAKKAAPLADDVAAARLATLGALKVVVDTGGARREASLTTLQRDAGQAVVVLGGAAAAVDDALLDALIQRAAFARADVVVVPVVTAGTAKAYDAPFVTAPAPADAAAWRDYVADEVATAEAQGADAAAGIVVALRRDGTVASRNIGKPPWPQLLADIDKDPAAKKEAAADDDDA